MPAHAVPGCFAPEEINQAFIASQPLIQQEIRDLTILYPNWLRDVWEMAEWPLGQGTVMQQLVFRGQMPNIERGFGDWENIQNVQGCEPCQGPDCAYHWTMFGGHAFDTKSTRMMSREFRTPSYCINEIQVTHSFEEVFEQIVKNIYRQTDYFKEMNIGLNFLTMLAKKFVVDSQGAKFNPNNPYVYRNTGGVRLSTLNLSMLEFFYENLRRLPDAVPFDVIDGSPIYSLMASSQLLARLYRDDPEVRQDVRFSSMADNLLMKYNFMSTIRGMFIAAPILYPRRFNIVAGEPMEVLPFVNNVQAHIGEYTYLNAAYEAATHEEVLIHGKMPFKIWTMKTAESLPGNASFGPSFSFMENWMWVNPQTDSDPMRRVGYFATEAKIGLSQQFSEGIYAILVERPSIALMAMYTPNPVCPVAPPVCTNIVPTSTCPCPVVTELHVNPMSPNHYYLTFATPITGTPGAVIQLAIDNGAYINGTLVAIDASGYVAEFNFLTGLDQGICANIIGIYCDATLGCSARVETNSVCRVGADMLDLVLSNPIKAITPGNVIRAYFADCTEANLSIVSVDLANLTWRVEYAAGYGPTENPTGVIPDPDTLGVAAALNLDVLCDRGGVTRVCVPTTTDATCPACSVTMAVCSGAQL